MASPARPSAMNLGHASLAVLLLIPLTGCGEAQGPAAVRTTSSGDSCASQDADVGAAIDWVPFVRVNGLMFLATSSPPVAVPESQVGPTVMTVTCTIDGEVTDPGFRPRDGDAAFLPVGTELREIDGYRPDFRLAAWEEGAWRVYEVDDVPDAVTGEDMLDLRDKVVRVHLVEGDRGERILRTVDRPSEVAFVVRAVLAAPVLPETSSLYDELGNESPVFVRFEMLDGTAVQRAWHVEAGLLWRRIAAPVVLETALSPRRP